ncbi:MAG: PAS domain S-box protein [bacterium]|nr:PAS domain S-box protein [bacterium]
MAIKEIKKSLSSLDRDELRREVRELQRRLRDSQKSKLDKWRRLEQEYKQKYLSFLDNLRDPVFIYDAISYNFLHCNEAAVSLYGYSREELLGMTPFDLHNPDDFEAVRRNIDVKSGKNPNVYTHLTKDRRERVVEITTADIYFEGSTAWLSIVHDISERSSIKEELGQYKNRLQEMINQKTMEVLMANRQLTQEIAERQKAELGILASEKKFKSVIEKFVDGVTLVDEKGSIIEWNLAQEKIYGVNRPKVIGKKIWDLQLEHEPHETHEPGSKEGKKNGGTIKRLWQNFLETGDNPFRDGPRATRIKRADGKLRDVQQLYFSIVIEGGVMVGVTTQDITKQLALEKQLVQGQKMEAVGTLAGGIAHDFNNILAGIMGYTDLAIRKTDKKAPIQKYLKQVLTASKRATDLVKQILTFSRLDQKEKEPLRLSSVLKEALKFLRSSLPTTIEIVSNIKARDCFVLADPTQLHQVIMNLCTNAGHAMKENGGILEVSLVEETVEDGLYKELSTGPHVRLTVRDTGYGIKPELIDKIFDPFFTTKEVDEGTGMGLSVVHRIIENHKGNISVNSKEGEGTTFSILLPMVQEVVTGDETPEEDLPRGSERILLVDDDVPLANAEKALLEELGYNVTAVTGSVEAFEIFQKTPGRFDFIITDYTMPRMTGTQFIAKIRDIRPEIPIILWTGHNQVLTPEKAGALGIGEVMMKPIDLGHIAKSIRRLLGT